jgi:hypothetical protein
MVRIELRCTLTGFQAHGTKNKTPLNSLFSTAMYQIFVGTSGLRYALCKASGNRAAL